MRIYQATHRIYVGTGQLSLISEGGLLFLVRGADWSGSGTVCDSSFGTCAACRGFNNETAEVFRRHNYRLHAPVCT